MNIFKLFTDKITSPFVSCMILLTAAGGALAFTPASRDVSDQRLPTFFGTNPGGTHTKKNSAASTTNPSVSPPATGDANVIVRDHRKPEGSQSASAPPAGTPTTKPQVPKGTEIRDHRPGGNADPCLKPHNTCSASARNASITEYRKQHPDVIGLDGDPCFLINSCNQSQLIESLIARAKKNLDIGFCDSRINGPGCAQTFVFPDGKGGKTTMVLHFQRNKGPLIEADKQRYLEALQGSYNKTLGGGTIQPPTASTAHRQN